MINFESSILNLPLQDSSLSVMNLFREACGWFMALGLHGVYHLVFVPSECVHSKALPPPGAWRRIGATRAKAQLWPNPLGCWDRREPESTWNFEEFRPSLGSLSTVPFSTGCICTSFDWNPCVFGFKTSEYELWTSCAWPEVLKAFLGCIQMSFFNHHHTSVWPIPTSKKHLDRNQLHIDFYQSQNGKNNFGSTISFKFHGFIRLFLQIFIPWTGISLRSFPIDSFAPGTFVDHLALVHLGFREEMEMDGRWRFFFAWFHHENWCLNHETWWFVTCSNHQN